MSTLQSLLDTYRSETATARAQGAAFEKLMAPDWFCLRVPATMSIAVAMVEETPHFQKISIHNSLFHKE